MLSEEVIEKVTERLVQRIANVNLFVLKKIARKIKELGTILPSNAHDIIQVMDYGGDIREIVKELSKATNLTTKEIYEIFDEVAKEDQRFAKKYYEYRKKKFIPWDENEALRREIDVIKEQTAEKFANIGKTRGIGFTIKKIIDGKEVTVFQDVSDTYKNVIDEGILSLSQGKTSFDEEMNKIMRQLAGSGLKYVDYESGYHRRLDSAVRMNLQDGIRQVHNKTQEIFGREFDADGVEVSVHKHPAPDHAEVQGRQFSIVKLRPEDMSEFDKFQNDEDCYSYDGRFFPAEFNERDRRSISQYNCYHTISSIILGVSKPQYTDKQLQDIIDENERGFEFEGKQYTIYEGTQLQRKLETEIRRQKDLQIMGKESGVQKTAEDSQRRINELTNKYYELCKASGLSPKIERLNVDGYKEIKVEEKKKEEPPKKEQPKNVESNSVFVSKEENERLANIWLDYYKNEKYLMPYQEERYNKLLEQKKNGFKDETIKLDSIENCNKLLEKINTEIVTEKGDIQNTDFKLLQETTECIYDYSKKYPAIIDDLKGNKAFIRAEKRTTGVANTMLNTITLNNSYFNDYDKFYDLCKDNTKPNFYLSGERHSWWSEVAEGNETKSVITHEFGHRLHKEIQYHSQRKDKNPIGFEYWLGKYGEISEYSGEKYLPFESNKKIRRDLIYEPIRRLKEKERSTQKEIINKYVSMYGRKSSDEMFAETFAGAMLGKPNELQKELIQFLIELGEWEE